MISGSAFLLLQGSVALHRRGDGIVLNSESAPFILGVSSQFSSEHLYVRALETSEIARVPLDCFNHIVAQLDLVGAFSKLLIYTASRVYEHCAQISQMSAYDIIRFQLVELMQEPGCDTWQKLRLQPILRAEPIFHGAGLVRILARATNREVHHHGTGYTA